MCCAMAHKRSAESEAAAICGAGKARNRERMEGRRSEETAEQAAACH